MMMNGIKVGDRIRFRAWHRCEGFRVGVRPVTSIDDVNGAFVTVSSFFGCKDFQVRADEIAGVVIDATEHPLEEMVAVPQTSTYVGRGWTKVFRCPVCGKETRQHLNFLGGRMVMCDGLSILKVAR